jgi:hypothetical protein
VRAAPAADHWAVVLQNADRPDKTGRVRAGGGARLRGAAAAPILAPADGVCQLTFRRALGRAGRAGVVSERVVEAIEAQGLSCAASQGGGSDSAGVKPG